MSLKNNNHLNDDELIWAVVDEAELPSALREHLFSCPKCRARKSLFEQNLVRLGQKAESLAPSPERKVSLNFEEPLRHAWWSWSWRNVLALTVTAAICIAVIWGSHRFFTKPDSRVASLTQEMLADERLMNEISLLVENALPQLYDDVSKEDNSLFDDEFMQFVVPSIEHEITSHDLTTRGVALC